MSGTGTDGTYSRRKLSSDSWFGSFPSDRPSLPTLVCRSVLQLRPAYSRVTAIAHSIWTAGWGSAQRCPTCLKTRTCWPNRCSSGADWRRSSACRTTTSADACCRANHWRWHWTRRGRRLSFGTSWLSRSRGLDRCFPRILLTVFLSLSATIYNTFFTLSVKIILLVFRWLSLKWYREHRAPHKMLSNNQPLYHVS